MQDTIDERYAEGTPLTPGQLADLEASVAESREENEDLELDADDDGLDL